jgi:predicted nuclease of predicted toxin-antitoxin system
MRILLDENLPDSLVDALQHLGHDVDSVNRLQMKGMSNGQLYHTVGEGYDLLFTKDKGFANNIRQQEPDQNTKLIHVILPQKPVDEFVNDFVEHFTETSWSDYENGDRWPET